MKKLFLLLPLLFIVSCYSDYKNPELALPAKEVSIRSLLAQPSVYDKRGVITKGKVWDLEYENLKFTVAKFKLGDKSGNHVDVISKEVLKVTNGDVIEVKGIFERNFDQELNKYDSYINAKEIKVKSDN